jgi:hypothetical protein
MTTSTPDEPLPLLCEVCGYDVSSLPGTAKCPECATPIADSQPASLRVGSPWQRAWAGARSRLGVAWILSGLGAVFRPGAMLSGAIFSPRGDGVLLAANLTIAAALLAWASIGQARELLLSWWPSGAGPSPAAALGPTFNLALDIVVPGGWWMLLRGLTGVERIGVMYYGRRRGWRVNRLLTLIITAHTSFLWIPAALLAIYAPIAVDRVSAALPAGLAWYIVGWRVVAGPLGFVVGMIWFEIATYFGTVACRYANPPDARRVA